MRDRGGARDRLTGGVYLPDNADEPVGAIEAAFAAVLDTQSLETRMREFQKSGRVPAADPRANVRDMAEAIHAAGGLDDEELDRIRARNVLRDRVIGVDDFPQDLQGPSSTESNAPAGVIFGTGDAPDTGGPMPPNDD